MKTAFYWKFAFSGITKNKKTYLPYIFSSAVMVMMQYLICFLSFDADIGTISGGKQMQTILTIGVPVVSIFSIIFLFYTNSFLIRRRKKEFGLYNVIGMSKRNLAKVLFCETIITTGISIGSGMVFGIIFAKLAQLLMAYMLNPSVSLWYGLIIDPLPILFTFVVFLGIFILIYLNALRQIHLTNPIDLLKSESAGEKPPKANPFVAILGAVILGSGYYIAVSMEDPMIAIIFFFLAVVFVMIGTYLLFVSGSVFICKLLKANKGYYYNKRHFVSVSSMMYRMKRNGAGLATICILSTAVLVMLSSTSCLLIGGDDLFSKRYPRDIVFNIYSTTEGTSDRLVEKFEEVAIKAGITPENVLEYDFFRLNGVLEKNKLNISDNTMPDPIDDSQYLELVVASIDDYNELNGTNEVLNKNEVLLCTAGSSYPYNTIDIAGFGELSINKITDAVIPTASGAMVTSSVMYLYADNVEVMPRLHSNIIKNSQGDSVRYSDIRKIYCFDIQGNSDEKFKVYEDYHLALQNEMVDHFNKLGFQIESREHNRSNYFSIYKGLFFLAILLGVICIGATVLIMYYKQITEGYEDKSRFDIMQKVGMTKKEISKSVNSQVLTVFFAPLIGAGIHMLAAFHIIWVLLTLFGLTDIVTLGWITVGCYLLFGVLYTIVYFITSRSYYNIVSRN